jgi:hypothetical protein
VIRLVGGPLHGNRYDLVGEVGDRIDLNSPAGVCAYEFSVSPEGETALTYVGPASPRGSEEATQRSTF